MRIWFNGKIKKERVIRNLYAQEKRQAFLLLLIFFHTCPFYLPLLLCFYRIFSLKKFKKK